ncbi:transcriptional regulator BetI [Rhodovulum sp. DZ06]|uniref:transcriptional regulator BetI n=1 Tax=Rhodovulum sp. DZ06 TaxID=3425126 RepID=UPI003D332076
MGRKGVEPARRKALVDAAIGEIGRTGSLDVTVSQIAKRAGMSPALAHHYFGSKEQIFLAAMRRLLSDYAAEVRRALAAAADTPEARLRAVVGANFADINLAPEAVAAWLSFYVRARKSESVARLLHIYHRRLRSNLLNELRPLAGARAETIALGLAAMIDGLYIRRALETPPPPRGACTAAALDYLDLHLAKKDPQ